MLSSTDVVVVSYNSREHLRACVEPLARSEQANVIVVDNASTDGCLATIDDLPVTVVAQDTNQGFAHGCNAGWRRGHAPHVLFLNPDTELSSEALAIMVSALDADASIGILGPQIRNDDGSLALTIHRFPQVRSTFSEALYLHHLSPASSWASETVHGLERYAKAHDAEWLSGACLLVRRDLLDRIGGLDEDYFMYSEDMQLCRTAWSCGYRVRYEPAAVVVHAGGASAPRAGLLPVLARSRMLYASKNLGPATALAHRVGFAVESITHFIVGRGGAPVRRGYAQALRTVVSGPSRRGNPR